MDIVRLDLQQDPSLPQVYAVDTTFLLAANSALYPTKVSSLKDIEHDVAFRTFLTYVCNGRGFHYVQPTGTKFLKRFPLLNLLESSKAQAKIEMLTPTGTEENYQAAAEDFFDYLQFSGGGDVASFVKFQFDDDDLVQVFFSGGEDEHMLSGI